MDKSIIKELELLESILENEIDHKYYRIGNNAEDASVIRYEDNYWQVYDYARGKQYDLFEFERFPDAAKELICRITGSSEQEVRLIGKLDAEYALLSKTSAPNNSAAADKVKEFITDPLDDEKRKVAAHPEDHK